MEKGLSHRQEPGIWTTSFTEARISNVLRLVLILEYEWPFNEERIKGAKRVDLSNLVHKDVGQGRVGRIPPMRLLPMNRWWYPPRCARRTSLLEEEIWSTWIPRSARDRADEKTRTVGQAQK